MEKLVGCFRIVQYPEIGWNQGASVVPSEVSSSLAVVSAMVKDREIYIYIWNWCLIFWLWNLKHSQSMRLHCVVSPRIRVATYPHANKRAIIIKIIAGGDCWSSAFGHNRPGQKPLSWPRSKIPDPGIAFDHCDPTRCDPRRPRPSFPTGLSPFRTAFSSFVPVLYNLIATTIGE